MISDSASNRIRYALDAKQFLLKILENAIVTMRSIQENAAKFGEKNAPNSDKKLKIP